MRIIILLALGLGILAWFFHLWFIIRSFHSEKRWTLYLDYNTKYEAVFELILFLVCIIISIIAFLVVL